MRRIALALLLLIIGILSVYSYHTYLREPKDPASQPISQRNLYIITVSGLQASHISSYLYQPIQTPAIDFLAYDGVRFTNAYTSSTDSLTAHLSILTGLYPVREPIQRSTSFLLKNGLPGSPKHLNTLSGILTGKGYRTAAFLSDSELRFPSFFGEHFRHAYTGDHVLYPWQNAYTTATVCRLARNWIKQNIAIPQFVVLNFSEPTYPFQPPAPYNKQYTRYPYDGEIAGVDEQIGLFVDVLKETGLFQKSVILLTSPYGESLSNSSRYASPSNSLLHIPLMITAPGLLPRKENYDTQVSLVDLMPTLLELLGYSTEAKVDGTPLFQKGRRAEVSREFVLGSVPFDGYLGLYPNHFIRTGSHLYLTGMPESVNAHQFGDHTTEEQRAEWFREDRAILAKEGIQSGPGLPADLETNPAMLLEKVHHLARDGHPEIAFDLLEVFSNHLPQTAYLETLKGMLAAASQDHETALSLLRHASTIGPTASTLALYARVAIEAGEPEEALAALRRYTAIIPRMSYDVRSTYAIALQELKRDKEALVEFGNVLKQNPRYAEAHLHRGRIWKKLGRFPEAEQDFKMAIEAQWDNVPAYRELAEMFEHQKPADAVPYLRQLLRFEPQNYGVMLQLATIHQKAGKPLEAKRLLQNVILYSDNPLLKEQAKKQLAAL
jgi:tetratricopeptide (TPR) repeat protein